MVDDVSGSKKQAGCGWSCRGVSVVEQQVAARPRGGVGRVSGTWWDLEYGQAEGTAASMRQQLQGS